MGRKSAIFLVLGFWAAWVCAAAGSRASEAETHVAVKRSCLPQSETREVIKARHLLEPFAVLKSPAAHFKAEALSAKLCRIGDEFVYDIAIVASRRPVGPRGMNAATGKLLGESNAREPAPKI